MPDEPQDQPEAQAAGEQAAARETAVGHSTVDEGATEVHEVPAAAVAPSTPAPEPSPPQPASAPPMGSGGTSPAAADRQAAEAHDTFQEKPELFVAGAFVGAFALGQLLKRITGGND
ncbi:MAG: hypothetical protein QOC95_634 [Thermoleophilaceae bacterium]|nr:hypothetical protein [Thermoleophilaceae bacterium]